MWGATRDQMWDGNENGCTLTAGVQALTRTLRQTSPSFAQPDTTLVLNANRGQSAEAIRTAAFGVNVVEEEEKETAPERFNYTRD